MGCCASSPSSPAPYNEGQHGNTSSRNPIISTQPHANLARPSTAQSAQPQQQPRSRRARGQKETADGKPDADLVPLIWTEKNRTWTRLEIDQEREDFFFTRVTGRQDVWQVIRTALEVIWEGGDAADSDGGWATAQAILGAASITVPDGKIYRGVFDQQGAKYDIPRYVVCDPTNLVIQSPVLDVASKDEIADKSGALSEEEEQEDEETKLQRREEKGKGVAVEQIQLKARRSDGGSRDLVITVGKQDTVKQILRKFTQSGGLTPPKYIMLYYLGKKLDPERTLLDQGWKDGHILQAFVSEAPGQQFQSSNVRST